LAANMKKLLWFVLLAAKTYAISVSPETAEQIGAKIWINECGGALVGLTHWGENENFPSLGIGHFIWYPAGKQDRFVEGFPPLVAYLKTQKAKIPVWIQTECPQCPQCPWSNRKEFYADFHSPRMKELRQFLYETRHLQALFIAHRLEKALPQMIESLSPKEREKITVTFNQLAKDPQGLYALIDYVNFKGEGTSLTEQYKGQGWGLLQVLQLMPATSKNIIDDFIASAKTVLTRRVQNSPPERDEARWLKGWTNRLETYKTP